MPACPWNASSVSSSPPSRPKGHPWIPCSAWRKLRRRRGQLSSFKEQHRHGPRRERRRRRIRNRLWTRGASRTNAHRHPSQLSKPSSSQKRRTDSSVCWPQVLPPGSRTCPLPAAHQPPRGLLCRHSSIYGNILLPVIDSSVTTSSVEPPRGCLRLPQRAQGRNKQISNLQKVALSESV